MSIDRCHFCNRAVDTDEDDEAYVEIGNMRRLTSIVCVCERCRDSRSEEMFFGPSD